MNLTPTQKERIAHFIPVLQQYLDSGGREADLEDRQARSELYAQLLSPTGLEQMTELEFGQVISSLWASQIWGNKGYLVNKLIHDNDLPTLVAQLHQLLWEQGTIAARYDAFRKAIKGLGPASITEILAFVHPEECGLWNDKMTCSVAYETNWSRTASAGLTFWALTISCSRYGKLERRKRSLSPQPRHRCSATTLITMKW